MFFIIYFTIYLSILFISTNTINVLILFDFLGEKNKIPITVSSLRQRKQSSNNKEFLLPSWIASYLAMTETPFILSFNFSLYYEHHS